MMTDPTMYQQDWFVVLAPNQPEQFLTTQELLMKLEGVLKESLSILPQDVQKLPSAVEQAQYLMETYCELDLAPGEVLQWYAVRLEK